jgi:malonyl-CoA O-methyltransferase
MADMRERQDRIRDRFAAGARLYDQAGDLQWRVAEILSERITAGMTRMPPRLLEIGCGTGFLSARLADNFPGAALTLSDIAPAMLERCRARLGDRHDYRIIDGEAPEGLKAGYDLIVSSLAFQWFADLPAALVRLADLLAPGGRLVFATLGCQTFQEWRAAHARLGLPCGTPDYPALADFPWPPLAHRGAEQLLTHPYADGFDFVASLKTLGAGEPKAGYRPLAPGPFRQILAEFSDGVAMTYHLLFGEITR